MQQLHGSGTKIQFGLKGWAAIGVGFAVVLATALLAIGLFIFMLPVLILAPAVFYFTHRSKTFPRAAQRSTDHRSSQGAIIDGEFRVIDSDDNAGKSTSR
jgi:hypothetical protein